MLRRMQSWLVEKGWTMKQFLELGEEYDMAAFESLLCVVEEIEKTVQQLKKDSKYYYYRGKYGKPAYAAH